MTLSGHIVFLIYRVFRVYHISPSLVALQRLSCSHVCAAHDDHTNNTGKDNVGTDNGTRGTEGDGETRAVAADEAQDAAEGKRSSGC